MAKSPLLGSSTLECFLRMKRAPLADSACAGRRAALFYVPAHCPRKEARMRPDVPFGSG